MDDDLDQAVLEVRGDVALVDPRVEGHAPPERPGEAFAHVEARVLIVRPALAPSGDRQHAAGEGDVDLVRRDAGELELDGTSSPRVKMSVVGIQAEACVLSP